MSNLSMRLHPENAAKQKHLENMAYLYEICGDNMFIKTKGDCRAAHEAIMMQYASRLYKGGK
jgi:hypothetical protein